MKLAVLIGVLPVVLAFVAGFVGFSAPVWLSGWSVYIAWFVASVVVGAALTYAGRARG